MDEKMQARTSHRARMLREHSERQNVFDHYEVIGVIKEGSMGAVSCVRMKGVSNTATKDLSSLRSKMAGYRYVQQFMCTSSAVEATNKNHEYALKTLQLGRIDDAKIEALRNEIDILRQMDHPNIVKSYETFQTKRQIYIVLELCSGGDLYTRSPYSESRAANIAKQLLSAVSYMHQSNIVHRDLKFENVLFETERPDANIKIIDFGLSKSFAPPKHHYSSDNDDTKITNIHLSEVVGTIYSSAPELLEGDYDTKADLWSVGVIVYMLLSGGKMPFNDKWRRFIVEKIKRAEYNYNDSVWEKVSQDAKDLIDHLFQLDPQNRWSADEAIQKSLWLQQAQQENSCSSDKNVDLTQLLVGSDKDSHSCDHFTNFRHNTTLKNIVLGIVAYNSTPGQIMNLRQAFQKMDTSGDGIVTMSEFKQAMQSSCECLSESQIENIFQSVDINHNGAVYYTEFLTATLELNGKIETERLADAFDQIDSDHKGYISKENLKQLVSSQYDTKMIDLVITSLDEDNDGKISFEEFLTLFRSHRNKHTSSLIGKLFSYESFKRN